MIFLVKTSRNLWKKSWKFVFYYAGSKKVLCTNLHTKLHKNLNIFWYTAEIHVFIKIILISKSSFYAPFFFFFKETGTSFNEMCLAYFGRNTKGYNMTLFNHASTKLVLRGADTWVPFAECSFFKWKLQIFTIKRQKMQHDLKSGRDKQVGSYGYGFLQI